ncbi:MAG: TauD/TfdA family dioxygenase [Pyrinomonadaceae bacterium]
MSAETVKTNLKRPGDFKRRAVSVLAEGATEGLVEARLLQEERSLPLLVQPQIAGVNLTAWASKNRTLIAARLAQHGAVLFRNFAAAVSEFEQFIRAVSGETLEYADQSSPRTKVSGNVYTSTDYPASQAIHLHNENSYSYAFPQKLFFACVTAPAQGGETPIADSRKIYERIAPAIRARFMEKQVKYVRNFGDGFGLDWRVVFQTGDRATVEAYCRRNDINCEWKDGDRLRTTQVRPAIVRHPATGEMVWFNHAVFFHITTMDAAFQEALLSDFAEEDLPSNTFYGDGTQIEPEVLAALREAYRQETVAFRWREGDVLMIDNLLTAHGRAPYGGERKIVVGMSELLTRADFTVN